MSKPGLIAFVHGLGGNPIHTWGRFPQLINSDPELTAHFDLAFYEFPTSLLPLPFVGKAPSADRLADGLRTMLDFRYPQSRDIVLAAHSLGGLIAKRYICNELAAERPLRIKYLVLFAVPNSGASLANAANLVAWRHRQLAQLCRNSDFLEALNRDWYRCNVEQFLPCRYVIGGCDEIVGADSARGGPDDGRLATDQVASHVSIVKPEKHTDTAFLVLRAAALEARSDRAQAAGAQASGRSARPHVTPYRLPPRPPDTIPAPSPQTLVMLQIGFFLLLCFAFILGIFVLIVMKVLPAAWVWLALVPVLLFFVLTRYVFARTF